MRQLCRGTYADVPETVGNVRAFRMIKSYGTVHFVCCLEVPAGKEVYISCLPACGIDLRY